MEENRYVLEVDFKSPDKKTESEVADKENEDKLATSTSQDIRTFFKKAGVAAVGAATFKWQLSLVGRNVGSSLVQEKIDAGMQLASMAIGVGTAFAVGGVLGGVAAMSMVGLNLIKDVEQYQYNANWENIGLSLSRERLGSSAAINRSRNV